MSTIAEEIGKKIKIYRKRNGMTIDDVAAKICKSKSTISKYENGEISMDIETMYDIAAALDVHVEQLLCANPNLTSHLTPSGYVPPLFRDVDQVYAYMYDGRSEQMLKCVIDILSQTSDGQYKVMMYMNYSSFDSYQICENTYYGFMRHFESLTTISLTNQHFPLERGYIQILASSLDTTSKLGLWNGLSSRPLMPVAGKMMISKKLINVDEAFINEMRISKDDIKRFKLYNLFPVM